jgi:O-methyltransferase
MISSIKKKLIQFFFPRKLKNFFLLLRAIFRNKYFIVSSEGYCDDGFATNHLVDFLKNKKFIDSYNIGKKTGALNNHNGDIHYRAYIACFCANYANNIKGDFVECGVGKGIIATTIVNYLDFNKLKKKFYLIDTYSGIPIDNNLKNKELKVAKFLNDLHFEGDYYDIIKKNFKSFPKVKLIKGKIPEILKKININKVSFLHLDMNNSYAEINAAKFFFKKISKGGLILLDDYCNGELFREIKNSWDNYAKLNNFNILSLPTGQGLIIKN